VDWDDLRIFLALARHRTLAAAARNLHVAESTVSRRLASLQSGIGARLLQRTADGYTLTLAGKAVLEHAESAERGAISAQRVVGGHDAPGRRRSCLQLTDDREPPARALFRYLARPQP
jgi:DNA-binding transcriptional LysR family regulator